MKSQFEQIESNALRVGNVIQMDLACMHAEKPKVSADEFATWAQEYAEPFRKLISQRPELVALYVEDSAKALHEIEQDLYQKEK